MAGFLSTSTPLDSRAHFEALRSSSEELVTVFPEITNLEPLRASGQKHVFSGVCEGAKVALKLFKYKTDERRVEREIEAVATLSSDYVPKVFQNGRRQLGGNDFMFLVEEFIEGEDYRSVLTQTPVQSLEQVLNLAEILLSACVDFEKNRIVHRDIKPENLLVGVDGKVWVIDFGICRFLDKESLTASGRRFGFFTPGYAPPEQTRNLKAEISSRADLYSIGVVLFEALNGSNPHLVGKRDILEVIRHADTTDLPKLSIAGDVDGGFAELIQSLTARYPSRRPKNAREALEWFTDVKRQILEHGGVI